ncbi:hypothetical protein OV079_08045 [Nannocystis pusilla]|uniref:Phosphoribosylformylglycinamidine cyclo-ligase n=1 Tax=Nannocystis pusilla TaxID=889268 RepID=A0A9X3EK70_9BACT|nr:hypothetical protein [Nannocystis pusilla]MCY1005522.1 hypothetical protein [Nannocystis pusilla]
MIAAVAAQGVGVRELLRTFNCGVGMLLYVDPAHVDVVRGALAAIGEEPYALGRVVPRPAADAPQVRLSGASWMGGAVEVE